MYLGFTVGIAGLATSFFLVVGHAPSQHVPVSMMVSVSGIALTFFIAMLDAVLLGRAVNRQFHRVPARLVSLDLTQGTQMGAGSRLGINIRPGHGARITGEINDGAQARKVDIVHSTTIFWNTADQRDDFLAARIREDGTCEVALDPLEPEQAFLLPWNEHPLRWLVLLPIVVVSVFAFLISNPSLAKHRRHSSPAVSKTSPSPAPGLK